ncbi:NUMOD4 motif protein [compost metagenome]
MSKVFKDIPGYEGIFSVSADGEIFSHRSNRVLKTGISKSGYEVLSSRLGGRLGKAVLIKVHRAVAMAWLEPPVDSIAMECMKSVYGVVLVNHKDGNKKK